MSFIGRHHELAALEEAWKGSRSAFVPIYGRRRVGKTELIAQFMTSKPGIYYVGKRLPAENQLREFADEVARLTEEPALAGARLASWKSAFELLVSRHKGEGKLIIALDEFQWMVEVSPELPSVLQELWDRYWSRGRKVMLIVCGSYLGFMEREVLGKRSPLFGRRTAQILLRPFNHLEARQFHPRLSMEDHARVYAICGGIPSYLLAFDQDLSVEQNIVAALIKETGVLAREPEFLLREELRDLIPYHAVLVSLAKGIGRPSDLGKATGIDIRGLNYHLSTLMDLGYVQRRYPLTDRTPSKRSVRYALDDPLLRFWFRFVFPNQSSLRVPGPEEGFSDRIRPELDAYFGLCYERLCREALPFIYHAEGLRAAYTIGEYWDKEVQIDVVGHREDNWTDIGECKWGAIASLGTVVGELERKVQRYPNQRGASIGRRIFLRASRRGLDVPAGVRVHSLADIYNVPDSRSAQATA